MIAGRNWLEARANERQREQLRHQRTQGKSGNAIASDAA